MLTANRDHNNLKDTQGRSIWDFKDYFWNLSFLQKSAVRQDSRLKRNENDKAVGPDEIPVEVRTCLGERVVQVLNKRFTCVMITEEVPREWRQNILGLLY